MNSVEEPVKQKESKKPNLLTRLGRSKIARGGAIGLSAVGLAGATFEGGKAFVNSVNNPSEVATPAEIVSADSTGYMADMKGATGNNPDVLFSYIKDLPKDQRPYFLVEDRAGKTVRVNIQSPNQLATLSFPQTGERLSIAGLTARDMYVRSHLGDLQGFESPALKVGEGNITKQRAETFGGEFYTGPSKNAPTLSKYHEGYRMKVVDDSVEVVIPPQPEAMVYGVGTAVTHTIDK